MSTLKHQFVPVPTPVLQPLRPRPHDGPITLHRTLPNVGRRVIGPWCFLDHYRSEVASMSVPPHPHCGLATVSWLLEGRVTHADSAGGHGTFGPGSVAVMNAGRGIAHAEMIAEGYSGPMHGVQLWLAFPEATRHSEPGFGLYADLPEQQLGSVVVVDVIGGGSPVPTLSPTVLREIRMPAFSKLDLPLNPGHEHGLLVLDGDVRIEKQPWPTGPLAYLGSNRSEVALMATSTARLLLVGGEPLMEEILIWWNFVARTWPEMREAKQQWDAHERFGEVPGFPPDARLPCPPVPKVSGI